MASDSATALMAMTIFGSGPGRGVACLIALLGVGIFVLGAVASLFPPLRLLEEKLPDLSPTDA